MLPTLSKTFRLVRRKNLAAEKKIWLPTKFKFLKVFGLMKILLSVSPCLGNYFFDLHRIRENERKTKFCEVRSLLFQVGQNSAVAFSSRSTFYSALVFELSGRRKKLATLGRKWGGADYGHSDGGGGGLPLSTHQYASQGSSM